MDQRLMNYSEQAGKLHRGLKEAVVVGEWEEPFVGSARVEEKEERSGFVRAILQIFCSILRMFRWKKPVPVIARPVRGVPHGVQSALVYAEDVCVSRECGITNLRFCHSHSYRVNARSILNGDSGSYPEIDRSRVSVGCETPPDGKYPIWMRVSVNGYVDVHVVQFGGNVTEKRGMSVGA